MTDIPPLFNDLWFRFLIGFLVGATLGSFVTMLSYRLPRRLSIVTPRSHCPQCKHTLRPRDLVPVASYLLMRGKCRHCGAEVGSRYVWIELATALLSAVAFAGLGFQPALILALAVIVAGVTIATMQVEKTNRNSRGN